MADSLYSDSLVQVLKEKVTDLAEAPNDAAVEKVISQAQKEAAERTPVYVADRWIYRGTVFVLGTAVLFVAYAQFQIVISVPERPIPDGLIALGSAAIGALAGLLAPTPAR